MNAFLQKSDLTAWKYKNMGYSVKEMLNKSTLFETSTVH